jgi:hypothetical protein
VNDIFALPSNAYVLRYWARGRGAIAGAPSVSSRSAGKMVPIPAGRWGE